MKKDFSARSEQETIGLSVSLAFIIVISLVGNSVLLLVLVKNGRLRSSFANKLIMSLSAADFLTAAIPLTYQLATLLDVSLIQQGGFLCTFGGLFSYTTFSISIMTMVMLTVDRFLALGYPMRYVSLVTPKVKVAMLAYPWIHGALLTIGFAPSGYVSYDPKGFDCGLSWGNRPIAFTAGFMSIHVALPFMVLLVLNSRTLWLVRKQNRTIVNANETSCNDAAKIQEKRRRAIESKLAKVSIVIVFVFLICWLPYILTRSMVVVLKIPLSSAVLSAAAWIVHSSSFTNPIIYSSLRSDVQQAVVKIFKRNQVSPAVTKIETNRTLLATSSREKQRPVSSTSLARLGHQLGDN